MIKNHARLLKIQIVLVIFTLLASNLACAISNPMALPTLPPTVVIEASSAPDFTPTVTNTWEPIESETPVMMDTMVPSATLAASATLASTRTPIPSATPTGFYSQDNGGFSLIYPASWKVDEDKSTHLYLMDNAKSLSFNINSFPEQTALTSDTLKKEVTSGFGDTAKITFKGVSSVMLANSIEAIKLDSTVKETKASFNMWVIYAHQGNRGYMVLITCQGSLTARQTLLSTVLKTITLFPPQHLYGLPHDQTLVLVGYDPAASGLDPALTTGSAEYYVGDFFAGLVRLTPDLKLAPELAEKWSISPDGMTYTFSLRKGLKFSNGKDLTAKDVKASWERACDPKTKSTTAGTYLGDIAGVKDKLAGKAADISGVKVMDDVTLAVTLDGPKPYFLEKLAYPTSYVVDTAQIESKPDKWMFSPNASGPYEVNKVLDQEAMLLKRNPNFWRPAGIENVIYLYNGDELSLYKEGTIDMAAPADADEAIALQKTDNPLHADLVQVNDLCTSFITLNPATPPLDDPNVRQALIMATDRATYNQKLDQGLLLMDNSILPPSMPGFIADHTYPSFDPAAAKAALAKSKYAGKAITVKLTVAGTAINESPSVALLVDMWQRNLGIKVQVEYLDPATANQDILKKKDVAIHSYGWCADYPDPENFLDVLFHTGTNFNTGTISLPELDALLEKARVEQDPAQRIALYQQAEALLLDQGIVIPMGHNTRQILVSPRVKNFVFAPMGVSYVQLLTLEPKP